MAETDVGVHPLDTDAGELPFYAITHHHEHLVRTGCHLEDGLLRIQGRTYRLGPEGQLPIDALHKAGIEGLVGKAIVLVTQVRAGDKGRPLALPHQGSPQTPVDGQRTTPRNRRPGPSQVGALSMRGQGEYRGGRDGAGWADHGTPTGAHPGEDFVAPLTYEADPDFLEHLHHEVFSSEQGQLLWDE